MEILCSVGGILSVKHTRPVSFMNRTGSIPARSEIFGMFRACWGSGIFFFFPPKSYLEPLRKVKETRVSAWKSSYLQHQPSTSPGPDFHPSLPAWRMLGLKKKDRQKFLFPRIPSDPPAVLLFLIPFRNPTSFEALLWAFVGPFHPLRPLFAFAGDPLMFLPVSADSWISLGQSVCRAAGTEDLGLAIVFILPVKSLRDNSDAWKDSICFLLCHVQPGAFLLVFFFFFFERVNRRACVKMDFFRHIWGRGIKRKRRQDSLTKSFAPKCSCCFLWNFLRLLPELPGSGCRWFAIEFLEWFGGLEMHLWFLARPGLLLEIPIGLSPFAAGLLTEWNVEQLSGNFTTVT